MPRPPQVQQLRVWQQPIHPGRPLHHALVHWSITHLLADHVSAGKVDRSWGGAEEKPGGSWGHNTASASAGCSGEFWKQVRWRRRAGGRRVRKSWGASWGQLPLGEAAGCTPCACICWPLGCPGEVAGKRLRQGALGSSCKERGSGEADWKLGGSRGQAEGA